MAQKIRKKVLVTIVFFAENLPIQVVEHHLKNINNQLYQNKEVIVFYEENRKDIDTLILSYSNFKFVESKLGLDSVLKIKDHINGDVVFYKTCNSIEWLPRHIDTHLSVYAIRKLNWVQSLVEFRDISKPEEYNIVDWRLTMPKPDEFEFDEISHSTKVNIDWVKIFNDGSLNKTQFIKQLGIGDLSNEISVIKWINTMEQIKRQIAQQLHIPVEDQLKEGHFPTILGNSLRALRNKEILDNIEKYDNQKINSIIIKRIMGMGDVILTEPIRRYLKEKYPNSKISLMTAGSRGVNLVAPYLGYDEVIFVQENQLTLDALMKDIKNEEIVENENGDLEVKETITYDRNKYQIKIDLDLSYESRPTIRYIEGYFNTIGVDYNVLNKEQKQYKIYYKNQDIVKKEKSIYICKENSGWQGKAWPAEYFNEIETKLKNNFQITQHSYREKITDLFDELLANEFYFGTDSGVMHIAMALGLKAIVIGGAAVTELTASPYIETGDSFSIHVEEKDLPCLGCKHKQFFNLAPNNQITFVAPCTNSNGPVCMSGLKPELIINIIKEILNKNK